MKCQKPYPKTCRGRQRARLVWEMRDMECQVYFWSRDRLYFGLDPNPKSVHCYRLSSGSRHCGLAHQLKRAQSLSIADWTIWTTSDRLTSANTNDCMSSSLSCWPCELKDVKSSFVTDFSSDAICGLGNWMSMEREFVIFFHEDIVWSAKKLNYAKKSSTVCCIFSILPIIGIPRMFELDVFRDWWHVQEHFQSWWHPILWIQITRVRARAMPAILFRYHA